MPRAPVASAVFLSLALTSSGWCQTPSPTAQIGAVPPPPWAPTPAPSAPVVPAPKAPAALPAQAPTILLVQVPTVAPAMQAAPVMTMAVPSAQSPGAAYGYVNPFVVSGQSAVGSGQQAIPGWVFTGATFIVDNPWIIDRILGRIGEALHKRGYPVLRVAPPGTITTTTPTTTTAPTATAAVVSSPTAPLVIYQQTPRRTALGRWFWGE